MIRVLFHIDITFEVCVFKLESQVKNKNTRIKKRLIFKVQIFTLRIR